MTTRVQVLPVALSWIAGIAAAAFVGFAVSRGDTIAVFASAVVAAIFVVGVRGRLGVALMVAAVALIQAPLGTLGSVPQVQPAEVVMPLLIGAMLLRTDALSLRRFISESTGARVVSAAVVMYATVILANFVRTRYSLSPVDLSGTNRTYLGYAVALGVYFVTFTVLRRAPELNPRVLRILMGAAAVACIVGLAAVFLHLPLSFGDLRYSVYDLSSGAVRVGFLETFGTVGLALALSQPFRMRPLLLGVFAVAIIVSGGRTAALGVMGGVSAFLLIKRHFVPILLVALLAAVLVVAPPAFVRMNPQVQRLAAVDPQALANDDRAFVYRASIAAFREHPVFGTGIGVPARVFARDPATTDFYRSSLQLGGHGTYLALLKNFGAVGFLPFAIALIGALWSLARRVRVSRFAGFFLICLVAQAIAVAAGGRGSDPFFFFVLGGAAAVCATDRAEGRAEA